MSHPITKHLSNQAIGDIIKAFRLAIKAEQEQVKEKERLLTLPTSIPDHELLKKQITQAQHEIHQLKFSFGQITGLKFGSDLEVQTEVK